MTLMLSKLLNSLDGNKVQYWIINKLEFERNLVRNKIHRQSILIVKTQRRLVIFINSTRQRQLKFCPCRVNNLLQVHQCTLGGLGHVCTNTRQPLYWFGYAACKLMCVFTSECRQLFQLTRYIAGNLDIVSSTDLNKTS